MAKDAWEVLMDATLAATSLIAQSKGVHDELVADQEKLHAVLIEVLKENMQRVLEEWKDAVEAHMTEAWLKKLMNVQANELGLENLRRMELIQ